MTVLKVARVAIIIASIFMMLHYKIISRNRSRNNVRVLTHGSNESRCDGMILFADWLHFELDYTFEKKLKYIESELLATKH